MRHMLLIALSLVIPAHADEVAAVIGTDTLMMSEVDAAGGPDIFELAEELYTMRVQALLPADYR